VAEIARRFNGGICLNKKCVVFSLLLVITLVAGLSLAQGQDNNASSAIEGNATAISPEIAAASIGNNSIDVNITADNASASAQATNASETDKAASEIAKMKGIWSISGIEKEQIIMAMKQDGQDLYGAAKYEPEGAQAWNAVAIGSVSGDNVSLVITALKGNDQVSTWLSGNVNETFSGKFFEVSGGNISLRGEFSATLVNPEITEYAPAKVAVPTSAQPAAQQESQPAVSSTTTSAAAANQTSTSQPVTAGGRKKPVDVHEYALKMGPGGDLSGVPPGMGGLL
jgi:hypothetical protein